MRKTVQERIQNYKLAKFPPAPERRLSDSIITVCVCKKGMLPNSKQRDELLNDTYAFHGIQMSNPSYKHSKQLMKIGTNTTHSKALQLTHRPSDPVKTDLSAICTRS